MSVTCVEPALFASIDPPRLAGSRCRACGTVTFPVQSGCPNCTGSGLATVALADRGTLWTWTVQGFEPKAPYRASESGFAPYAVGYVDLRDVMVEARLVADQDELEIGMPMRLVLLPLWHDEDGEPVVTYAFEPEGAGG